MPALIPKPIVDISDTSRLLPPFLPVGSKITFKKDSQYHKGHLSPICPIAHIGLDAIAEMVNSMNLLSMLDRFRQRH
jgi:hypothetical protein